MSYKKSEMVFDDYKWSAYPSDDPRITGVPDSTLFNRHEGYEMLYLINNCSSIHGSTTIGSQKIERMLRTKLPSDVRSQVRVKDWLRENW